MVTRQAEVEMGDSKEEVHMRVGSIEAGLEKLQGGDWIRENSDRIQGVQSELKDVTLGRVFVIGGAQIYKAALSMGCCERILWTRIEREWECDVWFLKGVLGQEGTSGSWERKEAKELDEWCGELDVGRRKEEDGVGFTIEMWERSREGEKPVDSDEAG